MPGRFRYLGIDLAWGESADANETGVVALEPDGTVIDAGWTTGIAATAAWIEAFAGSDAIAFVDAPLLVLNESGQRLCEKQVGQRYGRWKVSANSTNLSSVLLGGVSLRHLLELQGWTYSDGSAGPPDDGLWVSECYPYTTLVGAEELQYPVERPLYKRKPRALRAADWRPVRAAGCDGLVERLATLATASPPMRLDSHPVTARLLEPSPLDERAYKHREDLIDAGVAAWTASLWHRSGLSRCQVLGLEDSLEDGRGTKATIIAPARPEQRPTDS